ncbi:MAG: SURF1 family cytochrome oxidase biogenesis protein [Dokdonella sp.]
MGGNALPAQRGWPKFTIYIDPQEIGADLGRPIDDRVILLDAEPGSVFMRDWTPQILPPERHQGYALQWFTFAFAALVIFIVLHWRRVQPRPR